METNDFLGSDSNEIKELLTAIDQIAENLEDGVEALSTSPNLDCYLTNNQVCEMLHISQRTLQDYRDKGRIAFYKLEGKILYKLSDIENMLETNYNKAWETE